MYEIEEIKKEISVSLYNILDKIEIQTDKLDVCNIEIVDEATDYIRKIKDIKNEIEDKRKYYVKAPQEYIRNVNAMFKPFIERLDKMDRLLRNKMLDYRKQIEKELQKEKEKGSAPDYISIAKTTKIENHTITYRNDWKFEIINENEIPREYLMINEMAIQKAINGDLRSISGIRIYNKKKVAIR